MSRSANAPRPWMEERRSSNQEVRGVVGGMSRPSTMAWRIQRAKMDRSRSIASGSPRTRMRVPVSSYSSETTRAAS